MSPTERNPGFISRSLEPTLRQAVADFPVVVLTGPRQSGKTTLLRHLFSGSHAYASLDVPDVRAVAVADPRGFLALHGPPVIFDEIQYAPELLAYIKTEVDNHRQDKGRFILTGSQNLLLSQHISETLAGRAAMLALLPLSLREIRGEPGGPLPWERQIKARNAGKRLVKAPKVYFTDPGILCYLAGIQTQEQALGSPLGGPLFEGVVLAELVKTQVNRGQESRVYFWRTSAGTEVDFVVEDAGRCIPIQAKLSSTPRPRMATGIEAFRRDFPESDAGFVVHTGDMVLPLGGHALALPMHLL